MALIGRNIDFVDNILSPDYCPPITSFFCIRVIIKRPLVFDVPFIFHPRPVTTEILV